MLPDKVVLDTNIRVSYILKSNLRQLASLIIDNDITVFTSQLLISELSEVLSRSKFAKYLTLPIQEYIHFHESITTKYSTTEQFSDSPDAKDNFLFDLAIQSKSSHIITGDKALLSMRQVDGLEVLSLTAFKKLLRNGL